MTDYAPQYTTREKFKIVGLQLVWALPVILFFKYIFFPWMNNTTWFLCHPFGFQILFYGIFAAPPLFLVLILVISSGKQHFNILKLGQYPLPNQKTFKPTRYQYGFRAKWHSYLCLIALISLMGVTIYGVIRVPHLISELDQQKLNLKRQQVCR